MLHEIKKEERTHKGINIIVRWHYDETMSPPWKEHDCHGDVSEWTTRDKRPHERIICTDRGSKRFYDMAGAMAKAKKEGWGVSFKERQKMEEDLGRFIKPGEILTRAVENDFNYLRRWCNNDWHWCFYSVAVEGYMYPEDTVGGFSTDDMDETTEDVIRQVENWLDEELRQAEYAACCDIVTVP